MFHTNRWILALLVAATGKSLLGVLSYLANPETSFPSQTLTAQNAATLAWPPEIHLLQVLALGIAGTLLWFNARSEQIFHLAGLFLTWGSGYASRLLSDLALFETSTVTHALSFLAALPLEVASAYFLWSFVQSFPEANMSFEAQRFFRLAPLATALIGVGSLIATGLIAAARHLLQMEIGRLEMLARTSTLAPTWLLVLTAIAALIWKRWRAHGLEKRRTSLFLAALVVLGGPVCLDLLASLWMPSYRMALENHLPLRYLRALTVGALLTALPFAAAYSVLVFRVVNVRLLARRAVRSLLARWTSRLLLVIPLLLLGAFLYWNRDQTLAEILTGWTLPLLGFTVLLAGVTLFYREPILEGIDRRFFRDRYNARRILSQLVYQIRRSRDLEELSRLVVRGINLAFQLETAALMIAQPRFGNLEDPRGLLRPLDLGSQLATWIHGQKDPLEIDLDSQYSALDNLPVEDRHWLVDGRIHILLPLFSSDGSLLAVLALGRKKSELPFLSEDYQLLTAIASSAALAIELLQLKHETQGAENTPSTPKDVSGPTWDLEAQANECLACSQVFENDVQRCPKCKIALEQALIPYVLRNIFRFEKRIGVGGMAVVYRATDLKLGRTVAIKTLPRVSPEAAIRLQKEARTAATVSHSGLAAVYGLETWRGTPMLILELLEGGTIAERLNEEGPLSPMEVISTGQTVALALERIHSVGILHRDIKPSNIGFTEDGAAKLLDFGIARIHRDLRRDRALQPLSEDSFGFDTDSWQEVSTSAGRVAGTLPYLSPEAVQGDAPTPLLDLWSLAVVLYEALAGENLFAGQRLGLMQLLEQIRQAQIPDITSRVQDCPEPLANFFRAALNTDQGQRPQTGRAFFDHLSEARRSLER